MGGRILSNNYDSKSSDAGSNYDASKPAYDLGPSWFWPGQSNMETLINELNLSDSVFTQQANGQSVYEDQQGNVQKGFYGISMEGAYRVNGGMRQIISKLEDHINPANTLRSTQVKCIEYIHEDNAKRIISTFYNGEGSQDVPQKITSKKVVISLPPRIAMSSIEFKPPCPESRTEELNSYATWMAGHAKVLVIYDNPFWLEQGLSGDAVSHIGPLREIHDASSHPSKSDGSTKNGYALFGFVGIPASYRKGNEDEIRNATTDQLVRLFGIKAAKPIDIVLQDWAQDKFTATEIDQSMNGGHANSSISRYTESHFNENLIWSGTETADHRRGFNGLLEGALEASIRTLNLLI